MNSIQNFINKKPNNFSEESVLISTYFKICKLNSGWFLNTINPPSGEWSKLILRENTSQEPIEMSFSKNMRRLDLILQDENNLNNFFLAEAKPNFQSLINQIDKTDEVFREQTDYINTILKIKINPIYGYICGLQQNNIDNEVNLIKRYLNLSQFSENLICILVFRSEEKVDFKLIYPNNIKEVIKETFDKIFS